MDHLSKVPGLGTLERALLNRQGWRLVHMETIDFVSEQHDDRDITSIFPATMQKAINTYGGENKVMILNYQHAAVPVNAGATAFRVTFYVLGKEANRVS